MKTIIIPLVVILLFVALVAGGVYVLAQMPSVQSLLPAGSAQGGERFTQGQIMTENGAVPGGMDGQTGQGDGQAEVGGRPISLGDGEGHHGEEMSLQRALPELSKNILVISAIVVLSAVIRKVTVRMRRRRAAAAG